MRCLLQPATGKLRSSGFLDRAEPSPIQSGLPPPHWPSWPATPPPAVPTPQASGEGQHALMPRGNCEMPSGAPWGRWWWWGLCLTPVALLPLHCPGLSLDCRVLGALSYQTLKCPGPHGPPACRAADSLPTIIQLPSGQGKQLLPSQPPHSQESNGAGEGRRAVTPHHSQGVLLTQDTRHSAAGDEPDRASPRFPLRTRQAI